MQNHFNTPCNKIKIVLFALCYFHHIVIGFNQLIEWRLGKILKWRHNDVHFRMASARCFPAAPGGGCDIIGNRNSLLKMLINAENSFVNHNKYYQLPSAVIDEL